MVKLRHYNDLHARSTVSPKAACEGLKPACGEGSAIARLNIRVQAGARKEQFLGFSGDLLRVAVQAPPVEGAANRALMRFLARSFHTSPSRIRLVRGEKSRIKTVELCDLTEEALRQTLAELMANSTKTGTMDHARAAQTNR